MEDTYQKKVSPSKELFIYLERQNYIVSITHKMSADYDTAVDEMVHLKPSAETLGTTQGQKCEFSTSNQLIFFLVF